MLCEPCLHGLAALAEALEHLRDGIRNGRGRRRVEGLLATVEGRGACRQPDGATRMIASALDVFDAQFADHARHGRCGACEMRAGAVTLGSNLAPATQANPLTSRLRVNPILCEAHGLCIELFPEWIQADEWGYPIIDERPIPPELLEHARRAVEACPTVALLLHQERNPPPDPPPQQRSATRTEPTQRTR